MEHKKFTFSKEERLHSKILIEDLFANSDSFFKYPFKVLVKKTATEKDPLVRVLISVPKRTFKKAVDRNKIKRIIKEAYRQNKSIVYATQNTESHFLDIAFIYTAKSILSCQEIERKIILILQTIKSQDEVSAN